jgi:ABC-type uncharacterized transport system substrate-binding protein
MRRREVIELLGGTAMWPFAAHAQDSTLPLIGVLRNSSQSDSEFRLAALRDGLRERGYIQGSNVAVEYRYADGKYERLPQFAAEFVQRRAALLFGSGNASALATKAATATTPVVFAVGSDPIEIGLVSSLNRPGGNVTGVSFFTILIGKRVELMRELLPQGGPFAYLRDENNPTADFEANELQSVARTLGQPITIVSIGGKDDLETKFAAIKQHSAVALIVAAGSFAFKWSDQLIELAARYALPTIYAGRELVSDGGLISYSGSQAEAHHQAGLYCARILKGDKPGDLPVLLPTKYELVINLKTAKALGLSVPASLIARADEVIE